MAKQGKIERAVRVVSDHGADAGNGRWSTGSGYLVGGRLVLTAAHVLHDRDDHVVQTANNRKYPARRLVVDPVRDVAVLQVTGANFGDGPWPASYGQVDRSSDDEVLGCSVVGFPSFKQHQGQGATDTSLWDTAHIRGKINPKANLPSNELEFRVDVASTPDRSGELGGPRWHGMSGAVLRARYPKSEDLVVGVITHQFPMEGTRIIRAVPVTELAEHLELRQLLEIGDVALLPSVPFVPEEERSPYWATVADLERRTPVLLDREEELAYLDGFAKGPAPYLWLIGGKWAGKTALHAHFVLHPPVGVDRVSFFINPNDADSTRFLTVVNDQLARLLGETSVAPVTAATGPIDTYRTLWERVVKRAEQEQRHLLLLVEGLDDDASIKRGLPSVASLLPRLMSKWTHVIVTTRTRPDIPADVDVSHPIYDAPQQPLPEPSPSVRVRTRAIEQRHRLCPLCKQKDEADAVPRIVDTGYWAGPQQMRSFALSASLAFPAQQSSLSRRQKWVFGTIGAAVTFWILAAAGSSEDSGGQAIVFVLIAVVVAVVLALAHGSKERNEMRARARRIWEQLWYCNRDGVVYWPETGHYVYPFSLRGFLFDPAVQAQLSPPEPQPTPSAAATPAPAQARPSS